MLLTEWNQETAIKIAKEEAMEDGREEGRKEGREKGIAIGLLQTARNMKAKGLHVSLIAEVTGLSEAEIEAIAIEA